MGVKLAGESLVGRKHGGAPERRRPPQPAGTPSPFKRVGVRLARALAQVVRKTPAEPLLRTALSRRLHSRVFVAPPKDALQVLAAIEAAGVRAWLVGGWGVDALLGRQTRRHEDVDVAISAAAAARRSEDVGRVRHAIEELGYVFEEHVLALDAWLPERLTFHDGGGRRVDVLPIDQQPAATFTTGTIAGTTVPCIAADVQVRFHTGYEPRDVDRRDVGALEERFGLATPAQLTDHLSS
jgi:lincosamide nucleotidyltransferase A/C/D/E